MSYERIKQIEENYLTQSKDLIARVNKEAKDIVFPQNILVYKMATDAVSSAEDGAVCERINDKFYFTETLVNRLMLLAYYEGARAIDERSREVGAYAQSQKTAEAVRQLVNTLNIDLYPEE